MTEKRAIHPHGVQQRMLRILNNISIPLRFSVLLLIILPSGVCSIPLSFSWNPELSRLAFGIRGGFLFFNSNRMQDTYSIGMPLYGGEVTTELGRHWRVAIQGLHGSTAGAVRITVYDYGTSTSAYSQEDKTVPVTHRRTILGVLATFSFNRNGDAFIRPYMAFGFSGSPTSDKWSDFVAAETRFAGESRSSNTFASQTGVGLWFNLGKGLSADLRWTFVLAFRTFSRISSATASSTFGPSVVTRGENDVGGPLLLAGVSGSF